ncbi:metallophosphoesterase [Candidatus Omnitrophota bacterium]
MDILENPEQQLTSEDLDRAFELIEQAKRELEDRSFDIVTVHSREKAQSIPKPDFGKCYFASFMGSIGCDGKVYPCDHRTHKESVQIGSFNFNDEAMDYRSIYGSEFAQVMSAIIPKVDCLTCPPMGDRINRFMSFIDFYHQRDPSFLDWLEMEYVIPFKRQAALDYLRSSEFDKAVSLYRDLARLYKRHQDISNAERMDVQVRMWSESVSSPINEEGAITLPLGEGISAVILDNSGHGILVVDGNNFIFPETRYFGKYFGGNNSILLHDLKAVEEALGGEPQADMPVYWGYERVLATQEAPEQGGLRLNITVLQPYLNTVGHRNGLDQLEPHLALNNDVIFYMEKRDEQGNVLEALAINPGAGNWVLIPSGWWHTTINARRELGIFADFCHHVVNEGQEGGVDKTYEWKGPAFIWQGGEPIRNTNFSGRILDENKVQLDIGPVTYNKILKSLGFQGGAEEFYSRFQNDKDFRERLIQWHINPIMSSSPATTKLAGKPLDRKFSLRFKVEGLKVLNGLSDFKLLNFELSTKSSSPLDTKNKLVRKNDSKVPAVLRRLVNKTGKLIRNCRIVAELIRDRVRLLDKKIMLSLVAEYGLHIVLICIFLEVITFSIVESSAVLSSILLMIQGNAGAFFTTGAIIVMLSICSFVLETFRILINPNDFIENTFSEINGLEKNIKENRSLLMGENKPEDGSQSDPSANSPTSSPIRQVTRLPRHKITGRMSSPMNKGAYSVLRNAYSVNNYLPILLSSPFAKGQAFGLHFARDWPITDGVSSSPETDRQLDSSPQTRQSSSPSVSSLEEPRLGLGTSSPIGAIEIMAGVGIAIASYLWIRSTISERRHERTINALLESEIAMEGVRALAEMIDKKLGSNGTVVVAIDGLSGAGKTTIAEVIRRHLIKEGITLKVRTYSRDEIGGDESGIEADNLGVLRYAQLVKSVSYEGRRVVLLDGLYIADLVFHMDRDGSWNERFARPDILVKIHVPVKTQIQGRLELRGVRGSDIERRVGAPIVGHDKVDIVIENPDLDSHSASSPVDPKRAHQGITVEFAGLKIPIINAKVRRILRRYSEFIEGELGEYERRWNFLKRILLTLSERTPLEISIMEFAILQLSKLNISLPDKVAKFEHSLAAAEWAQILGRHFRLEDSVIAKLREAMLAHDIGVLENEASVNVHRSKRLKNEMSRGRIEILENHKKAGPRMIEDAGISLPADVEELVEAIEVEYTGERTLEQSIAFLADQFDARNDYARNYILRMLSEDLEGKDAGITIERLLARAYAGIALDKKIEIAGELERVYEALGRLIDEQQSEVVILVSRTYDIIERVGIEISGLPLFDQVAKLKPSSSPLEGVVLTSKVEAVSTYISTSEVERGEQPKKSSSPISRRDFLKALPFIVISPVILSNISCERSPTEPLLPTDPIELAVIFLKNMAKTTTGLPRSFRNLPSSDKSYNMSITFTASQAIGALLLENEKAAAKKIGLAYIAVQDEDGGWADAYDVETGEVGSDAHSNRMVGPVASMGRAMVELYAETGEQRFLNSAIKAADWMIDNFQGSWQDPRTGETYRFLRGGEDQNGEAFEWSIVEHNSRAIIFLYDLAKQDTEDADKYEAAAVDSAKWITEQMWQGDHFEPLWLRDGHIDLYAKEVLDAQFLPILAFHHAQDLLGIIPADYAIALEWNMIPQNTVIYNDREVFGYARVIRTDDSVWIEATLGMACVYLILGQEERAKELIDPIKKIQNKVTGGVVHAIGVEGQNWKYDFRYDAIDATASLIFTNNNGGRIYYQLAGASSSPLTTNFATQSSSPTVAGVGELTNPVVAAKITTTQISSPLDLVNRDYTDVKAQMIADETASGASSPVEITKEKWALRGNPLNLSAEVEFYSGERLLGQNSFSIDNRGTIINACVQFESFSHGFGKQLVSLSLLRSWQIGREVGFNPRWAFIYYTLSYTEYKRLEYPEAEEETLGPLRRLMKSLAFYSSREPDELLKSLMDASWYAKARYGRGKWHMPLEEFIEKIPEDVDTRRRIETWQEILRSLLELYPQRGNTIRPKLMILDKYATQKCGFEFVEDIEELTVSDSSAQSSSPTVAGVGELTDPVVAAKITTTQISSPLDGGIVSSQAGLSFPALIRFGDRGATPERNINEVFLEGGARFLTGLPEDDIKGVKDHLRNPIVVDKLREPSGLSMEVDQNGELWLMKSWPIKETTLDKIASEFSINPVSVIVAMDEERSKSDDPDRLITVVDVGAGAAIALKKISIELKALGIENVRLVAFGNETWSSWLELPEGVDVIFDTFNNLDQYFEDGEIDFIYSYWGLKHEKNINTFETMIRLLRNGGELLSNFNYIGYSFLQGVDRLEEDMECSERTYDRFRHFKKASPEGARGFTPASSPLDGDVSSPIEIKNTSSSPVAGREARIKAMVVDILWSGGIPVIDSEQRQQLQEGLEVLEKEEKVLTENMFGIRGRAYLKHADRYLGVQEALNLLRLLLEGSLLPFDSLEHDRAKYILQRISRPEVNEITKEHLLILTSDLPLRSSIRVFCDGCILLGTWFRVKTSSEQLALAISHEVAHLERRDAHRTLMFYALHGDINDSNRPLFREFSHSKERAADRLGLYYLAQTGYDLEKSFISVPGRTTQETDSHPNKEARYRDLKMQLPLIASLTTEELRLKIQALKQAGGVRQDGTIVDNDSLLGVSSPISSSPATEELASRPLKKARAFISSLAQRVKLSRKASADVFIIFHSDDLRVLEEAARMYKQGIIGKVLISDAGAKLVSEVLERHGVKRQDILIENMVVLYDAAQIRVEEGFGGSSSSPVSAAAISHRWSISRASLDIENRLSTENKTGKGVQIANLSDFERIRERYTIGLMMLKQAIFSDGFNSEQLARLTSNLVEADRLVKEGRYMEAREKMQETKEIVLSEEMSVEQSKFLRYFVDKVADDILILHMLSLETKPSTWYVVDNVSGQIVDIVVSPRGFTGFAQPRIYATKFYAYDDVVIAAQLDNNGKLLIGGGRPNADGSKPKKAKAWGQWSGHANERGYIIFQHGIVKQFISIDSQLDGRLSLVWDTKENRYTTAFKNLRRSELNQLTSRHEIHEWPLDSKGIVNFAGYKQAVFFGKPFTGYRSKLFLDNESDNESGETFIVGSDVVEDGRLFASKRLVSYYPRASDVMPGNEAFDEHSQDMWDTGKIEATFEYAPPEAVLSKLDNHIARGERFSEKGKLNFGVYLGICDYASGATVEIMIIDGEPRFVRFIHDRNGKPIVDKQGRKLVIRVGEEFTKQIVEKAAEVLLTQNQMESAVRSITKDLIALDAQPSLARTIARALVGYGLDTEERRELHSRLVGLGIIRLEDSSLLLSVQTALEELVLDLADLSESTTLSYIYYLLGQQLGIDFALPGKRVQKGLVYTTPEVANRALNQRPESERTSARLNRAFSEGGDSALLRVSSEFELPLVKADRPRLYPTIESALDALEGLPLNARTPAKLQKSGKGNLYAAARRFGIPLPTESSLSASEAQGYRLYRRQALSNEQAPMKENKLYELWQMMEQGDNEARDELISYFMALVIKAVEAKSDIETLFDYGARSESRLYRWDDYIQQGNLAILEALDEWDLGMEEDLESFMRAKIEGSIHEWRKVEYVEERRTRSLSEPLGGKKNNRLFGTDFTLEDRLEQPDNPVERFTFMRERLALIQDGNLDFLEDESIDLDRGMLLSKEEKIMFMQELRAYFIEKGIDRVMPAGFGMWLIGSMGNIGIARRNSSDVNILVVTEGDHKLAAVTLRDLIGTGIIQSGDSNNISSIQIGGGRSTLERIMRFTDFIDLVQRHQLGEEGRNIASIEVISIDDIINADNRPMHRARFHITENINQMGTNAILVMESQDGLAQEVQERLRAELTTSAMDYEYFVMDYSLRFFAKQVGRVIALQDDASSSPVTLEIPDNPFMTEQMRRRIQEHRKLFITQRPKANYVREVTQINRRLNKYQSYYSVLGEILTPVSQGGRVLFIGPGMGFEMLDILDEFPGLIIHSVALQDLMSGGWVARELGYQYKEEAGQKAELLEDLKTRFTAFDINFGLPYPDNTFEAVIVGAVVMQYIINQPGLIEDIYRVLKDRGKALVENSLVTTKALWSTGVLQGTGVLSSHRLKPQCLIIHKDVKIAGNQIKLPIKLYYYRHGDSGSSTAYKLDNEGNDNILAGTSSPATESGRASLLLHSSSPVSGEADNPVMAGDKLAAGILADLRRNNGFPSCKSYRVLLESSTGKSAVIVKSRDSLKVGFPKGSMLRNELAELVMIQLKDLGFVSEGEVDDFDHDRDYRFILPNVPSSRFGITGVMEVTVREFNPDAEHFVTEDGETISFGWESLWISTNRYEHPNGYSKDKTHTPIVQNLERLEEIHEQLWVVIGQVILGDAASINLVPNTLGRYSTSEGLSNLLGTPVKVRDSLQWTYNRYDVEVLSSDRLSSGYIHILQEYGWGGALLRPRFISAIIQSFDRPFSLKDAKEIIDSGRIFDAKDPEDTLASLPVGDFRNAYGVQRTALDTQYARHNTHNETSSSPVTGKNIKRIDELREAAILGDQSAIQALRGIVHKIEDVDVSLDVISAFEVVVLPKTHRAADIELRRMNPEIPALYWRDVKAAAAREGYAVQTDSDWINRSLVTSIAEEDKVLVIKLLQAEESPESLHNETAWMEYLGDIDFPERFDIPTPILVNGSYVFKLLTSPVTRYKELELHPEGYAIAFIADKDYFAYPNSYLEGELLTPDEFKEVMFRNARLLGNLISLGIVHTDITALFHAAEWDVFEWWRDPVGHLENWYYYCDWPNIGLTGPRDLEHLIAFRGTLLELQHYIGSQLLSLFLISASYFRNRDRSRVGINKRNGKATIDARDLFDPVLLRELVEGIISSYYEGATGQKLPKLKFDFDEFTARMIQQTGIDRYTADGESIMFIEEFGVAARNMGFDGIQKVGLARKQDIIDLVRLASFLVTDAYSNTEQFRSLKERQSSSSPLTKAISAVELYESWQEKFGINADVFISVFGEAALADTRARKFMERVLRLALEGSEDVLLSKSKLRYLTDIISPRLDSHSYWRNRHISALDLTDSFLSLVVKNRVRLENWTVLYQSFQSGGDYRSLLKSFRQPRVSQRNQHIVLGLRSSIPPAATTVATDNPSSFEIMTQESTRGLYKIYVATRDRDFIQGLIEITKGREKRYLEEAKESALPIPVFYLMVKPVMGEDNMARIHIATFQSIIRLNGEHPIELRNFMEQARAFVLDSALIYPQQLTMSQWEFGYARIPSTGAIANNPRIPFTTAIRDYTEFPQGNDFKLIPLEKASFGVVNFAWERAVPSSSPVGTTWMYHKYIERHTSSGEQKQVNDGEGSSSPVSSVSIEIPYLIQKGYTPEFASIVSRLSTLSDQIRVILEELRQKPDILREEEIVRKLVDSSKEDKLISRIEVAGEDKPRFTRSRNTRAKGAGNYRLVIAQDDFDLVEESNLAVGTFLGVYDGVNLIGSVFLLNGPITTFTIAQGNNIIHFAFEVDRLTKRDQTIDFSKATEKSAPAAIGGLYSEWSNLFQEYFWSNGGGVPGSNDKALKSRYGGVIDVDGLLVGALGANLYEILLNNGFMTEIVTLAEAKILESIVRAGGGRAIVMTRQGPKTPSDIQDKDTSTVQVFLGNNDAVSKLGAFLEENKSRYKPGSVKSRSPPTQKISKLTPRYIITSETLLEFLYKNMPDLEEKEDLINAIIQVAEVSTEVGPLYVSGGRETGAIDSGGGKETEIDLITDRLFATALKVYVTAYYSEDSGEYYTDGQGQWLISMGDSLDGSSKVKTNGGGGTIMALRKKGRSIVGETGEEIVASLMITYGIQTKLIIAVKGLGAFEFILDKGRGQYYKIEGLDGVAKLDLTRTDSQETRRRIALGGSRSDWPQGFPELVDRWIKEDAINGYSGALVTDLYAAIRHIMHGGQGLYAYLADKLRVRYELQPLAFILKEALGADLSYTYTGKGDPAQNIRSLLDIELLNEPTTKDQQRAPSALGSKGIVEEIEEAIGSSSPVSPIGFIYRDDSQERKLQIQALLSEIEEELKQPATGNLPKIAIISDYHGDVARFAEVLSDVLNELCGFEGSIDPSLTIQEQLKEQGLSLKTMDGAIYLNGDLLDRGKYGMKCFNLARELIEAAPDRVFYVSGNHDFWAFGNLLGFHLPWYKGFNFYDDKETEELIAASRALNPQLFDSYEAFLWWTERLAEYNEFQTKADESFLGGEDAISQIRSKFVAYYEEYSSQWNAPQLDIWESFVGYFKRISVPKPYVGLNGIGKTSGAWWRHIEACLIEEKPVRENAGASSEELATWQEAIELATVIRQEVEQRLNQALQEGRWWHRVFESINTQAYISAEWWCKDWSSHKGWGEEVIKEINEMRVSERKLTQANYPTSKALQALAKFYRSNFNLYLRDPYGNMLSHGWFPAQEDGQIVIEYQGKAYSGRDIFEGLTIISDDVKDESRSLHEIWEAMHVVNSWYGDATTQIKPNHIKAYREEIGIALIQSFIEIHNWFTGHNILSKLKTSFMNQDGDYAHFEVDKAMAEKFGGEGAYVLIGPDGITLRGFESNESNEIIDDPRTPIVDKKTGDVTYLQNSGMPAREFLTRAKKALEAELHKWGKILLLAVALHYGQPASVVRTIGELEMESLPDILSKPEGYDWLSFPTSNNQPKSSSSPIEENEMVNNPFLMAEVAWGDEEGEYNMVSSLPPGETKINPRERNRRIAQLIYDIIGAVTLFDSTPIDLSKYSTSAKERITSLFEMLELAEVKRLLTRKEELLADNKKRGLYDWEVKELSSILKQSRSLLEVNKEDLVVELLAITIDIILDDYDSAYDTNLLTALAYIKEDISSFDFFNMDTWLGSLSFKFKLTEGQEQLLVVISSIFTRDYARDGYEVVSSPLSNNQPEGSASSSPVELIYSQWSMVDGKNLSSSPMINADRKNRNSPYLSHRIVIASPQGEAISEIASSVVTLLPRNDKHTSSPVGFGNSPISHSKNSKVGLFTISHRPSTKPSSHAASLNLYTLSKLLKSGFNSGLSDWPMSGGVSTPLETLLSLNAILH